MWYHSINNIILLDRSNRSIQSLLMSIQRDSKKNKNYQTLYNGRSISLFVCSLEIINTRILLSFFPSAYFLVKAIMIIEVRMLFLNLPVGSLLVLYDLPDWLLVTRQTNGKWYFFVHVQVHWKLFLCLSQHPAAITWRLGEGDIILCEWNAFPNSAYNSRFTSLYFCCCCFVFFYYIKLLFID